LVTLAVVVEEVELLETAAFVDPEDSVAKVSESKPVGALEVVEKLLEGMVVGVGPESSDKDSGIVANEKAVDDEDLSMTETEVVVAETVVAMIVAVSRVMGVIVLLSVRLRETDKAEVDDNDTSVEDIKVAVVVVVVVVAIEVVGVVVVVGRELFDEVSSMVTGKAPLDESSSIVAVVVVVASALSAFVDCSSFDLLEAEAAVVVTVSSTVEPEVVV
ncbi:hypothetical protein LPJ75_004757, partial [Coemansia sp. RSA 2598]